MKLKILIIPAVLILLAACSSPQKKSSTIAVMDYAELKPLLHKNTDTLYVVNFWASWCTPCVKELPDFERVNAEFKNQKFKMLLLSLDFPKQIETQLIPFIKANNIKAEVKLFFDTDANHWINDISEDWSGSIPATLIYNKNYRSFHEGTYTYEELKQIVESNLY